MKHLLSLILAGVIMACGCMTSCKTTEENYRAAYDKAVAGRDSLADFESTVYGRYRRQMRTEVNVVEGDTVAVRVQAVSVTPESGGTEGGFASYGIVVGQFKQLFNAQSLRGRLVEAGYASAFLVNTAEPYYFVVLDSYKTLTDANAALKEILSDEGFPVALKSPLPFILKAVPDKKS